MDLATIEDVAARAGVSRMTVSRVINNKGYVSEEARARVEAAIEALHYKPNILAKALVTKRTSILAYVMVNISDPFHNLVKQGFESSAYHGRYTSMMCDVHSAERQRDYFNMFQEICIGGAVFHHLAVTEEQIRELEQAGIQCVLLDNEYDLPGVSAVVTDNYAGGRMAAEHLLDRGHRRIGCVHGHLSPSELTEFTRYENTFQFRIWQQRTAGFVDVLAEHGLTPAGFFLCNGQPELAEPLSYDIVDQILSAEEPITALYCEDDVMALTVYKRLQERGVKVPEQMAIIGHDGLDMIKMLHPQMTTIEQPRHEMGRLAAQILIEQIEKGTPPRRVVLSPRLSVGETT